MGWGLIPPKTHQGHANAGANVHRGHDGLDSRALAPVQRCGKGSRRIESAKPCVRFHAAVGSSGFFNVLQDEMRFLSNAKH